MIFKISLPILFGILAVLIQSGHTISFDVNARAQAEETTFNIHVSFKKNCDHILDTLMLEHAISSTKTHEEKVQAVYDALIQHSKKIHEPFMNTISMFSGIKAEALWIANKVFIENATVDMIRFIRTLDNVADVEEERIIPLAPIIRTNLTGLNVLVDGVPWGIQKIGIPAAWSNGGKRGAGIRVFTIDTGVRGTHEALKDNFLGTYGWLDPINKSPKPVDDVGHGTHTMGTICGRTRGIGVAPDIRWMSCKACSPDGCLDTNLIRCGQFAISPTIADGTKPNQKQAPHIVSNSWGGGQGQDFYNMIIKAWHAAGIIPVFSIGNSGPSCESANSPGDQNVISVGATDKSDNIAFFSSVGPSTEGRIKPDISAPGVGVTSSWNSGDNKYAALDGTSMACPHVAGVTALLKSQNPKLDFTTVQQILYKGCQKALPTVSNCGGTTKFPNNIYGNGRLSADKSVALLKQQVQCQNDLAVQNQEEASSQEIN